MLSTAVTGRSIARMLCSTSRTSAFDRLSPSYEHLFRRCREAEAVLASATRPAHTLLMAAASKRVSRVLRLVDELELAPAELGALREELDARRECQIDLDACNTEEDIALAKTLKRRIDAASRGETRTVPMDEAMRIARQGLRRRRATP